MKNLKLSRRSPLKLTSFRICLRIDWLPFTSVSNKTAADIIRVEEISALKVESVGGISSFRLARRLWRYHRNVLGNLAPKVFVLQRRIILAPSQLLIEPNCTRLKLIMCPDSHWC